MNLIGIIGIIIGLCLFSPLASIQNKRNKCSSYILDRIISVDSYVKRRRFRRVRYYVPTVEYEVNGILYVLKYKCSFEAEEYYIGDSFWVMYNPHNPHEITQEDDFLLLLGRIAAFFGVWSIALSLILMLAA